MPVPQPEEVLELASALKDAREHVAKLETRWIAFFNLAPPPAPPPPPAPVQNLKPRIVQFLEERPDVAYNMATVAKALDANENSVGPYLSELAKEGKIEKRERGLYGAKRPAADNA